MSFVKHAGCFAITGVKIYCEENRSATIKGWVKGTVKEIACALKLRFQEEGWIDIRGSHRIPSQ